VFLQLRTGQKAFAIDMPRCVEADVVGVLVTFVEEHILLAQTGTRIARGDARRLAADGENAFLRHAVFDIPYQRLVAEGEAVQRVLAMSGTPGNGGGQADGYESVLLHLRIPRWI